MAHKTLISGTAYSVTGGRELIGGTGYGCKAGKALIGGTAFIVPFSKGIPLSTVTPGAILYLNESGILVPFYIAKHDYESVLNGAGRTLVVRKENYDERPWDTTAKNNYPDSTMDAWLNSEYLQLLSEATKAGISETKFYYSSMIRPLGIQTMQRRVFTLSCTELNPISSPSYVLAEGNALPIASILAENSKQWTRSPYTGNSYEAVYFGSGRKAYKKSAGWPAESRPVFTLPDTTTVVANADGTYSLAS